LFPNTTLLNINHNQLAYLDQVFRQIPQLIDLHAAHNQIQLLSPDLAACQQLLSIDLSNNILDSIPAVLSELPFLEQLNLAYNQVSIVGMDHPTLERLIHLDISYNPLKEISEWLKKLSFLKKLNLSGIPLGGGLANINGLKQLESLRLKNCQLSNKDLLNLDWKHLMLLDVRQNNLKSDCLVQLKKQNPTTNILA
jgi:Leucine-rich repeat (LRR) protein